MVDWTSFFAGEGRVRLCFASPGTVWHEISSATLETTPRPTYFDKR